MNMPRAPSTLLLALAACGLRPYDFDAAAGSTGGSSSITTTSASTTSPTTGPDTSSSSTSTSSSTSSSTGGTTGVGFIISPDGGGSTKECDLLQQTCPEGQKCNMASLDGDGWFDSTLCVPLAPDPAGLYEPCTYDGPLLSGHDTCDKSLICWEFVPDTQTGICYGLCKGDFDEFICDDPTAWCYARDGVFMCFPQCDPLYQACLEGESCLPDPMNPGLFACYLDASGDEGQAFDPCEAANECDPGLLCANPALAKECDAQASGCCVPFCHLSGSECPGADQQCVPFFEEGMPAPGYTTLGLCALPQ